MKDPTLEIIEMQQATKEALRQALAQPNGEWVGLTDEERKQIVSYIHDPFEWSHAIEQALKEKNG